MALWIEVAGGVFQRRYQPYDVTVCVVRGANGLLVVDTRSSHREAGELRTDLAMLADDAVRWVVNTHAHFDHCFGNVRFGPDSDLNVPIYGHEGVPAHLADVERPMLEEWIARRVEPVAAWREVVITPPTELIALESTIDLGDRTVELMHLGRGHTDNDLVVHVPDAHTWLVGDLLEESGPPAYGPDSFPLEWPDTVTRLRHRLVDNATLVPGHGAAVPPSFVDDQLAGLRGVATLIRELQAAGVPAEAALRDGGDRWPFPPDGLVSAISVGYRQLGDGAAR